MATKQAEYAKRQKAKGYSLVSLWVPTKFLDRIKKYAKRLRSNG